MHYYYYPHVGMNMVWPLCLSSWISLVCMGSVFSSANSDHPTSAPRRILLNTWPFSNATDAGWKVFNEPKATALDAVEATCNNAEYDLNIPTVGYGGSPDEEGNTTLDAMIMDGESMEAGAVASMHGVKDAVRVARAVLRHTRHTLLMGWAATEFAREMGFTVESSLNTPQSVQQWKDWRARECQPNFRRNVFPDPKTHCGPYEPLPSWKVNKMDTARVPGAVDYDHHDTIGAVALDDQGHMAVATSTNGAAHRVPGRVGDTAIVGAGGYADDRIGAAAGTGDGDVLMRFLLSYEAVQLMGQGKSPTDACEQSLDRVKQAGPWSGALIALDKHGRYGGACVGFESFALSVRDAAFPDNVTHVVDIPCRKFQGYAPRPH